MSEELKTQEGIAEAPATEHVEQNTHPAPSAVAEAVTEAVAETPIETGVEAPAQASTESVPEGASSAEAEAKQPEYDVNVLYPELVAAKNQKTAIEVTGLRRVRGGILVSYKGMPLFLPTSHLSLKPNPSENELLGLLQKTFNVHVHELNEEDKTKVIVTRRRLLRVEHLNEFQVGQVVEGKVVQITDFGVFVNLGSVDGMVHVSAMSRRRVNHPSELVQKGDTVRAVIKEINQNSQRLSLSMKELEANPWTDAEKEFPAGSQHKGKIKSLTDFGAYVELKPGVEGLIHISEMSWARRIKHPSELFQIGQEVTVHILEISEAKQKVALGYKQTQANPWETINQRFHVGQIVKGTVKEVIQRGVVVSIADDIDAFMPRGKMHPSVRSKTAPFQVGDQIDNVLVMDVVAENHSLILGMEGFDQGSKPERGERGDRSGGDNSRGGRGGGRRERDETPAMETKSPVTLSDLLSEEEKRKLFGENAAS